MKLIVKRTITTIMTEHGVKSSFFFIQLHFVVRCSCSTSCGPRQGRQP